MNTPADSTPQPEPPQSRRSEEYFKKYKDPRWQKTRLKIMERDEFTCQRCLDNSSTLHVHHRYYLIDKDPWEYPRQALVTLCEECHTAETQERSDAERALIRACREHFFTEEINTLAVAFYSMKLTDMPVVVADAIAWAVRRPEVQVELVSRYLDDLYNKES